MIIGITGVCGVDGVAISGIVILCVCLVLQITGVVGIMHHWCVRGVYTSMVWVAVCITGVCIWYRWCR